MLEGAGMLIAEPGIPMSEKAAMGHKAVNHEMLMMRNRMMVVSLHNEATSCR